MLFANVYVHNAPDEGKKNNQFFFSAPAYTTSFKHTYRDRKAMFQHTKAYEYRNDFTFLHNLLIYSKCFV